jgi:hypothetical protein
MCRGWRYPSLYGKGIHKSRPLAGPGAAGSAWTAPRAQGREIAI